MDNQVPAPVQPIDYATPLPRRPRWPVAVAIVAVVSMALALILLRVVRQVQVVVTAAAPAPAAVNTAAIVPPTTPTRVTVVQRHTEALPGTNRTIFLHLDNITHGQVLMSVSDSGGKELLPLASVRRGDVRTFNVGSASFDVEVLELRNFLVGDDFGVFAVRATGSTLSEDEKIDRLIDAVANARGLTFIRNGESYGAADAAEHLTRKRRAAAKSIKTARQFITDVASRSSTSGEPYRIRLADGHEMPADQWLAQRLDEIEGRDAAATRSTTPATTRTAAAAFGGS